MPHSLWEPESQPQVVLGGVGVRPLLHCQAPSPLLLGPGLVISRDGRDGPNTRVLCPDQGLRICRAFTIVAGTLALQ